MAEMGLTGRLSDDPKTLLLQALGYGQAIEAECRQTDQLPQSFVDFHNQVLHALEAGAYLTREELAAPLLPGEEEAMEKALGEWGDADVTVAPAAACLKATLLFLNAGNDEAAADAMAAQNSYLDFLVDYGLVAFPQQALMVMLASFPEASAIYEEVLSPENEKRLTQGSGASAD